MAEGYPRTPVVPALVQYIRPRETHVAIWKRFDWRSIIRTMGMGERRKEVSRNVQEKIIRAPGSSELYAWLLSPVELAGLSAPLGEGIRTGKCGLAGRMRSRMSMVQFDKSRMQHHLQTGSRNAGFLCTQSVVQFTSRTLQARAQQS
jgi:hypothetical protein